MLAYNMSAVKYVFLFSFFLLLFFYEFTIMIFIAWNSSTVCIYMEYNVYLILMTLFVPYTISLVMSFQEDCIRILRILCSVLRYFPFVFFFFFFFGGEKNA